MKKLSVVVLNWNQADLTIACLNSLLKAKKPQGVELEIILTDNNSSREEKTKIRIS
jgi:GT2 family glycosyltransferase